MHLSVPLARSPGTITHTIPSMLRACSPPIRDELAGCHHQLLLCFRRLGCQQAGSGAAHWPVIVHLTVLRHNRLPTRLQGGDAAASAVTQGCETRWVAGGRGRPGGWTAGQGTLTVLKDSRLPTRLQGDVRDRHFSCQQLRRGWGEDGLPAGKRRRGPLAWQSITLTFACAPSPPGPCAPSPPAPPSTFV